MKQEKIVNILSILVIICIALVVYVLVNFYNDYKCSTTTDIKWFIDNDCMRYMR